MQMLSIPLVYSGQAAAPKKRLPENFYTKRLILGK